MERWVKLYDKFTEWEWFDNSHMVHVFIYLFLRANTRQERWHGIEIGRGQLVTSVAKIAADTHISTQSVRTCLKRLLSTGEIVKKSTNQSTIITIVNYDRYQQSPVTKPIEQPQEPAQVLPVKPPTDKGKEESYKEEMQRDTYWQEIICMRYHIAGVDILKEYINRFWLDAACRDKSHDDLRDAKAHFANWLSIILNNEKKQQANGTTQNRRRGFEVTASSAEDYKTSF